MAASGGLAFPSAVLEQLSKIKFQFIVDNIVSHIYDMSQKTNRNLLDHTHIT